MISSSTKSVSGRKYILLSLLGSVAALAWPAAAGAQTPPATPQAQPSAVQSIETVVVTAEKRSQRLIDVPTSISVVTKQAIDNDTMIALSDIATRVPNVVMTGSSLFPNVVIRGIGSESGTQTGMDPAAVVYVDDVYQGRERAEDIPLDGVQQIEVLRGPQGTLYGENTIGGAINVTTLKPSDTFIADADVQYGNLGFVQTIGELSGPLNQAGADNLFGSVTGFYRERDGWIHNDYDNQNLNYDRAGGGRARLIYDATSRLSFDFSADYMHENDTESLLTTSYAPFMFFIFPTLKPLTPDSRDESVDSPENGRRTVYGASARVDYDFGDAKLTSISAYRAYTSAYAFDSDGTPEPIDAQNDIDNANLFTQELRLTSEGNGPFQWIIGAYYSHQRLVDDFHTIFLSDSGLLLGLPPFASNYFDEGSSRGDILSNSYAVYVSGTYNITPRWTLAGGVRFTLDQKSLRYSQGTEELLNGVIDFVPLVLAPTPAGGVTSSLSKAVPTGDISLSYKVDDDQSAYIKFSRGYKAGGFDAYLITQPFNYSTQSLTFAPEYLNNYETGYKASWWDGKLTLNADVFYDQYTNIQEAIEDPLALSFKIENATTATIYGAEIESEVQPIEGLTFSGSLGLLHGKFGTFDNAGVANPCNCLTGNTLPNSPRLEGTIAGMYERELPWWPGYAGFLRVELTHTDSSYTDPNNTPAYVNGPVTYLNGRTGIENSNWGFYLWGNNLTNQFHVTSGLFEDVATARAVNMPRTYGVELSYKF